MPDFIALLGSLQGLIGAVFGALIATVSSRLAGRREDRRDRRKLKEREYLLVIDAVHRLRLRLHRMMNNANSQFEARAAGQNDVAMVLDSEGTKVVDEVFAAIRELDRLGDHLRICASRKVIAVYKELSSGVWDYLKIVGESTRIDGRVRWKDYASELDSLQARMDELVAAIRRDLGY